MDANLAEAGLRRPWRPWRAAAALPSAVAALITPTDLCSNYLAAAAAAAVRRAAAAVPEASAQQQPAMPNALASPQPVHNKSFKFRALSPQKTWPFLRSNDQT